MFEDKEDVKCVCMDSYNIYIGYDLIDSLPNFVQNLIPKAEKYLLISDEYLYSLYGEMLKDHFEKNGLELLSYSIPVGEKSKCREEKSRIEDYMFEKKCNIESVLIGFGGGVVGDLTGFIASTYMRGINYIHIPTSTIAMIDSSIGGKTGINVYPFGKNLLGSFYPPKSVLIDIQFLKSLSSRDLFNGISEAIKMALICDEQFFIYLENHINEIETKDLKVMKEVIYRSVQLKGNVVLQDEKERTSYRSILNFGHSIGHAIESLSNGKFIHGECVSIGMILEGQLARNLNLLNNSNVVLSRMKNLFKSFHLPIDFPNQMKFEDILLKMSIDKKNRNGKKHLVILTNIGSVKSTPSYTTPIDDQHLINLFDRNILLRGNISRINESMKIHVPGSKSVSNRILILCALGKGVCEIDGLLYSIDTQTMLICLKQLGVQYSWNENNSLIIQGTGGRFPFIPLTTLYLNNSGTSSRFLTSLCTLLPKGSEIILTGDQRLKERPIEDLTDVLKKNETNLKYLDKEGCLPILIQSNGTFKGGEIFINGNISSQFLTSLLLISPFASESVLLKLNQSKAIVSEPYIDMTIELMKNFFNISINRLDQFSYYIDNCGSYNNPLNISIEGDASSASYFLGMCAVHPHLTLTIENIGYQSTQGDSQFCRLLEKMGCQIIQTEKTTKCIGPEELIAIEEEIDMNRMTDTFITLSCVAAFAKGITKIRNISNQRLKECNRIEATVKELNRCGIKAWETENGLDIQGNNNRNILQSAFIHCYDDHRIAMAFSIMASRGIHLIIEDKHCVEKTYPQFWIDLEKVFDLKTISPQLISKDIIEENSSVCSIDNEKSIRIYLIGMPHSGKSTMGEKIAKDFNYSFIDLDEEIRKEMKTNSLKEYIDQYGRKEFHSLELEIFQRVLKRFSLTNENVLISCGGGCVETKEFRELLSKEEYVIYLNRDIEDIKEESFKCQLDLRPKMDFDLKLKDRKRFYRQCSKYEYSILKKDNHWNKIQKNFSSFIRRIIQKNRKLEISNESFFICLTYKDLLNVSEEEFQSVILGCEAIELRIDLLQSFHLDFLGQQIAYLRKYSSLPIIYTLRTKSHYGTFPDDQQKILQLLNDGTRLGCDILDCQSNFNGLIEKKSSFILSSLHIKFSLFNFDQMIKEFLKNSSTIDLMKIVFDLDNEMSVMDDVYPIFLRLKEFFKEFIGSKLILIVMGEKGNISRILNRYLTPVTHPLLPSQASKGQLTVKQIQETRSLLNLIEKKQFFLFGTSINRSLSPNIHQTGFDYFYLPYQYHLHETNDVLEVERVINDLHFGGGSVTIPLKEDLYRLFLSNPQKYILSDSAKKIGAVNTITKLTKNSFQGDNTDWMAISKLIRKKIIKNGSGLVIGAGGTARAALYAFNEIKEIERIYLYNPRHPEKANDLSQRFESDKILPIREENINDLEDVFVVINTLPSSVHFQLNEDFFQNKSSSKDNHFILFDVNYLPYQTSLLKQGEEHHWTLIHGIDMLIEQGLEQFQIWTGGKVNAVSSTINKSVRKIFSQITDLKD